METGSVTFHKPHDVMMIKIEKDAPIVKQLTKTKREEYPDLRKMLEEHKAEISEAERLIVRQQIEKAKAEKKVIQEKEKERDDFFKMQNNQLKSG